MPRPLLLTCYWMHFVLIRLLNCFLPNVQSCYSARVEVDLNRLLRRFHHIATAPGGQPEILNADPSLRLYMEAQYRVPIIARWPAVARFLAAHRERVANLMSPVVAGLCERWLTATPVELAPGVPTPYRKEFAEIALATARALQVAQGKVSSFWMTLRSPSILRHSQVRLTYLRRYQRGRSR